MDIAPPDAVAPASTINPFVRINLHADASFIRTLDPNTRVRFNPDAKRPVGHKAPTPSRQRYEAYCVAKTYAEFLRVHPFNVTNQRIKNAATPMADLCFDLNAGHAHIHVDDLPDAVRCARFASTELAFPKTWQHDWGPHLPEGVFTRDDSEDVSPTRVQLNIVVEPPVISEETATLAGTLNTAIAHALDMERMEGYQAPADTDAPTENIIGDEKQYSPHYIRAAQVLSDGVNADHDDPTLEGYSHLIDVATAMGADVGPGIPLSVTDAMKRPDYLGPHGWQQSLAKEIARVQGFGAWELASSRDLWKAKSKYGDRCAIGHIVIAFRNKVNADGYPKNPSVTKKSRVAFADDKAQNAEFDTTFSGCADDITDRVVTAVGQRVGARFDTCDVAGAYFHGTPTHPDDGGRAVFAEVPRYLKEFNPLMKTHDAHGRKNYLRIIGNMPGRKDAGVIWARRYDEFLTQKCGMKQSFVDRRLFILSGKDGILLAHVHVDDTRLTFTSDHMRAWFLRLWDAEFGEGATLDDKLINRPYDEDFVGIKRHVVDERTTQYSSLGVIKNLGVLISPYPLSGSLIDAYPMSGGATR